MASKKGFFVRLGDSRKDLINSYIDQGLSFSDAFNSYAWDAAGLQISLLSFNKDKIDYVCLSEKRAKVVTGKSRVDFFDFVPVNNVGFREISEILSNPIKKNFAEQVGLGLGKFPKKTWKEVINAIKELTTINAEEIDRLLLLKKYSNFNFQGKQSDLLLMEREAIGIAFDIFGKSNELRKKVLREWAPKEENIEDVNKKEKIATINYEVDDFYPAFLEGLSEQHIQEESAIQHDMLNYPDYQFTGHKTGVSKFNQGSRTLNIFYANRNKLENTLGVDLIYFKEEFNAFILVQYKLMDKGNETDGYYYRPDDQLLKEHNLISEVQESLKSLETLKLEHHAEYRFMNDPFMYKLVPNKGVKAGSSELISGMYVTSEYMDFLIGPHGPRGPRGGKKIGFDNAPRYLTNTEFTSLVNKGFIGTNFQQSSMLQKSIRSFLESNKAIVFAIEGSEREELVDKKWLDNNM